jgi:hypothetical protein
MQGGRRCVPTPPAPGSEPCHGCRVRRCVERKTVSFFGAVTAIVMAQSGDAEANVRNW